jgi:hypothetical protein
VLTWTSVALDVMPVRGSSQRYLAGGYNSGGGGCANLRLACR